MARAFTLVETLVVVGIATVLAAIFVPFLVDVRERHARVVCAQHLSQINNGLQHYALSNQHYFPRVVYDAEHNPNGWTSFTGADCDDPFAEGASVRPNDVTASVWLLVRTEATPTAAFICPSTADMPDALLDAAGHRVDAGRRGNFRGIRNLSYSYAQPFTSALKYRLDDNRRSSFALMADRNPGKAHGRDVRAVRENDPPLKLAMGNSRNHRGAGQNVLFASGNVEFTTTPYCGDGRSPTSTGDNIFTALRPVPLEVENPPANEPGVLGQDVGAAWGNDAYLVPYDP